MRMRDPGAPPFRGLSYWHRTVRAHAYNLSAATVYTTCSQTFALRAIRAEVAISIGAVTRALNKRKIPTAHGLQWHVSTVANLLARAQRLEELR